MHNEAVTLTIKLTSDMQMKGEYGTNLKNRDSDEYFTGRWQELFVELIFETLSSKSKIIEVDINEEYKKNYDQSSAMVKEEVEKEKDSACICKEYDLIWGNKFLALNEKKSWKYVKTYGEKQIRLKKPMN